MRTGLIPFLLIALLSSQLAADMLPDAPYVVVQGKAERSLAPDRFEINITVEVTSMSVSDASSQVETTTAGLVKMLKETGLSSSQLMATNIAINAQYQYDNEQQKRIFTGNQVSRDLTAKFEDKKRLQQFLAGLPESKAIRVGGINSSLSTHDKVAAELLDQAVEDARRQADLLLEQFDQQIIGIHTISQQAPTVGFESQAFYKPMEMVSAAPPALGDTFEEGVITVRKDVYVVYLIAAE